MILTVGCKSVVESLLAQGPPELHREQLNHLGKYWLIQFVARRQSARELTKIYVTGFFALIATILTAAFSSHDCLWKPAQRQRRPH